MLNAPRVIVADADPDHFKVLCSVLGDIFAVDALQVKSWTELTRGGLYGPDLVVFSTNLPEHPPLDSSISCIRDAIGAKHLIVLTDRLIPELQEKAIPLLLPRQSGLSRADVRKRLAACSLTPIQLPDLSISPWDDLILRQQLKVLDYASQDEMRGKLHLQKLIYKIRPTASRAEIFRLSQGRSGALVFRVHCTTDGKFESWILKVCPTAQAWKFVNESRHWPSINGSLNVDGVRFHVPPRVRPVQPSEADEFLVQDGPCCAQAWTYLGKSYAVADLEKAYSNPAIGKSDLAERLILETLKILTRSWYKDASLQPMESLWITRESGYGKVFSMPPYRFTSSRKVEILSSLETLGRLGEKVSKSWHADVDLIRDWINGAVCSRPVRKALLSRVHGDLNVNNLLVWYGPNEFQPFLIDFATYQSAGHTFQDFAGLEAQIKFALMDNNEDTSSPAYDFAPERFPLWCTAERVLARFSSSSIRSDPHVGRATNLIRHIRDSAFELYSKKVTAHSARMQFFAEYGSALLYHTLRAISYENLSMLKRIFAVTSAALLVTGLTHTKRRLRGRRVRKS